MLARSADNSSMIGASPWCIAANGSTATCLINGQTYLQFDATFNNGSDTTLTPALNDLTINFSGYTLTALPSSFALLENFAFPPLPSVNSTEVMMKPFLVVPTRGKARISA